MESLNIATSAGIVGLTNLIMELVKRLYFIQSVKSRPWYGTMMNQITLAISLILTGVSYVVSDISVMDAIINGVVVSLFAVGGYELVINLIRSVVKKK